MINCNSVSYLWLTVFKLSLKRVLYHDCFTEFGSFWVMAYALIQSNNLLTGETLLETNMLATCILYTFYYHVRLN